MQFNAQAARQGLSYKWLVVIVVIIGSFMSGLDQTIVNIAIPRLQNAFGADIHSVQWVTTGYTLALGALTPASSYLANNFGIKRPYLFALLAFTLGSALCGLSWSLPVLILFRVLQGVGGAILFPLSLTLLFREFAPEERGVALGTLAVPVLLAPALGPIVGGYLVTYAAWQIIFFINVPIGLFGLLMAWLILRDDPGLVRTRFDLLGFLTIAYGLAAVLYAVSQTSTDGWSSPKVLAFLLTGALSLLIFVIIELTLLRRDGQPLFNLGLFTNRSFAAGNIALILAAFALFGAFFLIPVYLQNLRGLSAFQAGLTLLPQALVGMVSVIIGGRLVDIIGARTVVLIGLVALALSSWEFTSLTLHTPYGSLELMLALFGVSFGFVFQPLIVAAMSRIQAAQDVADASTLTTVTRSVASSIGVAILATIVDSQRKIHFAHLAEQVTVTSPTGHLLLQIQSLFMSRGADVLSAGRTAVQLIAAYLQKQAYMLGMRDAFFLGIVLVVLAVIATLFLQGRLPRTETSPEETEAQTRPEPVLV